MYMFPLLLFFTVIFARLSTTYDSRNCGGKYIIVKNRTLAKVLIEKENVYDKGRHTLQKDRNKMSVIGLVFYLCDAFIVALFGILFCLPKVPCTPLEINARKMYLYADTLNEKIPIIFASILLCVEFLYLSILLFRFRKEIEQKWIRILVYILSIVFCLVCTAVIVMMLFELFNW